MKYVRAVTILADNRRDSGKESTTFSTSDIDYLFLYTLNKLIYKL